MLKFCEEFDIINQNTFFLNRDNLVGHILHGGVCLIDHRYVSFIICRSYATLFALPDICVMFTNNLSECFRSCKF